ncbi:hypothetical protein OCH239_09285 [Roseivivax halodurans JCM 10272]|uniref:Uncharacterized protein n=1 Tax=Roseivivax halodurans JCM 10272 TaxID=1449350 RepID=X7ECN1_9RHOB|nr:hypothetical protein [Roseivivax halodurans]ETX13650.1 hypothetical protein OCH239_09285 [Roseivivax halodurans JCM 10272]
MSGRGDGPLDAALQAWCAELRDALEAHVRRKRDDRRRWAHPAIEFAVNDRAVRIDGDGLDLVGIAMAEIQQPEPRPCYEAFLAALRAEMPMLGWPVRIRIELDGIADGSWWRARPVALGVCGKLFGTLGARPNDMVTRRQEGAIFGEVRGLDRLVEGMRLIDRVAPASNRPVSSWSIGSDVVGAPHVHVENVHARSEAELVLKIALFRRGLDEFRDMIRSGRFEPLRNDERCWFVASELDGLEHDPLGVRRDFTGVMADINGRLAMLGTPGLEP